MKRFHWLLLSLLILAGPALGAQNRTALVIGNAGYRHIAPLQNTLNDADDITADLRAAGFEVEPVKDAGQNSLIAAVERFVGRLRERGGVGLIYYSGHGVQVDGHNYLVPVDAELKVKGKLKYEAYALDDILGDMGGRGAGAINLVILDACRDNPFPGAKGGAKGLARVEAPESTLILYAAKPGQTADDNLQGRNGLFTQHLRAALQRPGVEVETAFSDVVKGVYQGSQQKQYPWKEGVLLSPFQLVPGAAVPSPAPPPAPAALELSYWESVKESGDAAQLQSYRERYPQGQFTQLAELKIRELKRRSEPPAAAAKPEPPPPAEGKSTRDPTTGMEFVKIEGGSFPMGSPSGEEGRDGDEKQHRVSVGDFYLGKHEVTNGQYRKFKPGHDSGKGDDHPVVNVDWHDATAYAEWVSRESGKQYRLPTEAEWEYACRAGGQDRYCGGNDLDALGWYDENSGGNTHPVGGKRANAWGLHDMSGNVWEWTCSAYDSDYGGSEKQCSSKNDATVERGLRGGSWSGLTRRSRAASRNYGSPGDRYNYFGFRLARTVSP